MNWAGNENRRQEVKSGGARNSFQKALLGSPVAQRFSAAFSPRREGSAVPLPSAGDSGVLGCRVLHQAPCRESVSPSACVSASVCVCVSHK